MPKIAHAHLKSVAPYSQSRMHDTPKLEKEGADEYEQRTWRNRLHVDAAGQVFIPPMAFKNCLAGAAAFLRQRIPGKGQSEYGKHFLAGVLVTEGLVLPIKPEAVVGERLYLNADGKRNGKTRVWRTYPRIAEWEGEVTYYVLDDTIPKDVFERHLRESGRYIGIGRFRPANGGFYGRFEIERIRWEQM